MEATELLSAAPASALPITLVGVPLIVFFTATFLIRTRKPVHRVLRFFLQVGICSVVFWLAGWAVLLGRQDDDLDRFDLNGDGVFGPEEFSPELDRAVMRSDGSATATLLVVLGPLTSVIILSCLHVAEAVVARRAS